MAKVGVSASDWRFFRTVKRGRALENQILDILGKLSWKIEDLIKALLEQDVKSYKPNGHLRNFLKKRPNLFFIVNGHVQSHDQNSIPEEQKIEVNNNKKKPEKESEKSQTVNTNENIEIGFEQLKPIEKDMLTFMGDMKWEINDLKVQLTGEKSYPLCKTFQAKGQLISFLKNRPHLFVKTDNFVQRNLLTNQDKTKQEENNLVPKLIVSCENFRNTSPIDVIYTHESILEI